MLTRPDPAPRPRPRPSVPASPEKTQPEIVFAWEKVSALAREIKPLFRQHWWEIALNKDEVPLDPDWERYLTFEMAGILHVLTVRSEGALIGYVFVCVGPHLHYASTTWAVVDMFWLNPVHRFGWTGVTMFRRLEEKMRELNVRVLHVSEKLHFKGGRVGVIFKRLGYRPIEQIWAKVLA
jgi:hypothetical protein